MSETVFIVWGNNEQLAQAVGKELNSRGYSSVVGGSRTQAAPNSFFINANVMQQMDLASSAIILVQKTFDANGQLISDFRPNLMFEWGYLQRRLRPEAIHLFLINIKREELPLDVLGSYSEVIELSPKKQPNSGAINSAAASIAGKFINNIVNIDWDGLDVIVNYDSYRTRIRETISQDKAFDPREAGYIMLHMIQPAFYRNDLASLSEFLRYYSKNSGKRYQPVSILIGSVLRYYEITNSLSENMGSKAISKVDKKYRELESISETLETLRQEKDKIFNIFDVILEDFIGLCRLRLYISGSEQVHLQNAISAFEAALTEVSDFKSRYPSNTGIIKDFWEAYIERNLGRAYSAMGDKVKAKKFQESGENKRKRLSQLLRSAGAESIAQQMDLEIGLSRFDAILQDGSHQLELASLIDSYLQPYKPSGVDRVWERLRSAISKEAERLNYSSILKQLDDIK